MTDTTDYVVRQTSLTNAGHVRVTAVDLHGRVAHVTIHRAHYDWADVDTLIRDRFAHLPTRTRGKP